MLKQLEITLEEAILIKDPLTYHVVCVVSCVLYLIMIFFLPGLLCKVFPKKELEEDEKKGKDASAGGILKPLMFIHNAFLSFLAGFNLFVGGYNYYKTFVAGKSYYSYVCDPEEFIVSTPNIIHFCVCTHIWSKYLELIDTLFLILKKPDRKVIFLQWWHHLTVLVFAHYTIVLKIPVSILLVLINSFIHFLMYYYYAKVLYFKKPFWASYLTLAQIIQMFICVFWISSFGYYYYFSDQRCSFDRRYFGDWGVLVFLLYSYMMYGSYIYLFITFFLKRYVFGKKKKKK